MGPTSGSSNIGLVFLAEGEMTTDATGVERGGDGGVTKYLGPTSGSSNIGLVFFAEGEMAKGATGVEKGWRGG